MQCFDLLHKVISAAAAFSHSSQVALTVVVLAHLSSCIWTAKPRHNVGVIEEHQISK